MYQVLIVDDERMIRMGIKCAVPWESIGIDAVYTAASGSEALLLLEEHHPQIMISDIYMSEMTGLELIDAAKQLVPDLRVIVLTGYERFDYARECLRLRIEEFLLKPVDENALIKSLQKQVEALDAQMQMKALAPATERARGLQGQVKLDTQMQRLVRRELLEIEIEALCKANHFDPHQTLQLAILVPTLYAMVNAPDKLRVAEVRSICVSLLDMRGAGITFCDNDGTILLVFFWGGDHSSGSEQAAALSSILKDEFEVTPRIVLGSQVEGFFRLHISYNDAQLLCRDERSVFYDVLQTTPDQHRQDLFQDVYTEIKNRTCANVGDPDAVLKGFSTFCKAAESYNLSTAALRRCCLELASSLYISHISQIGAGESESLNALANGLLQATRNDACEMTRMFLCQMLEREDQGAGSIVAAAQHYIEDHLSEDLSVADLAALLYVTPNYFSRLFKRVTGKGCNEYITQLRIEKASFLLQSTSFRTGRIAMMVGYNNTNYFSLAFKKHTGRSPTQYREEKTG